MREATERLRQGGLVMTGLDRPLTGSNYRPRFFGYPSALPVTHIALAIKARVPVVVAAVQRQANGKYLVDASEPIEMESYPDHHTELERNAESVLKCAEEFIRRVPQQWVMYYPVWPEALAEMP
jgi:KDO2-lipid IV(A) lauroyltransferase